MTILIIIDLFHFTIFEQHLGTYRSISFFLARNYKNQYFGSGSIGKQRWLIKGNFVPEKVRILLKRTTLEKNDIYPGS